MRFMILKAVIACAAIMNKNELIKVLQQLDITPTKSKGQNFLMDEQVVFDMVDKAEVGAEDVVVEIGPGLGVLTEVLASKAKKVIAIELDQKIISYLKKEVLPNYPNVHLIEGDVLASGIYHQLVGALQGQPYKLVANLPYQITSKVLRQFLETEPKPVSMTVMVQKEVAQRIVALPGKMSLLSLSVQAYSVPELFKIVKAGSFFPSPKVDSAVLHLDLTKPDAAYLKLSTQEQQKFWHLVKMGFSSKRKQLKNNLQAEFKAEKINLALESLNLSSQARAQELSVADWCQLVVKL